MAALTETPPPTASRSLTVPKPAADIGLPRELVVANKRYLPERLIARTQLDRRVGQMGVALARRYDTRRKMHILALLKGGVTFAHALEGAIRQADPPLQVTSSAIKVSSYDGMKSSGSVTCEESNMSWAEGRHILVADDVLDSGNTHRWLLGQLDKCGAASVELAVALQKDNPERTFQVIDPERLHVAFPIENVFVIGYGLDLDEQYRELPDVVALREVEPSGV